MLQTWISPFRKCVLFRAAGVKVACCSAGARGASMSQVQDTRKRVQCIKPNCKQINIIKLMALLELVMVAADASCTTSH